MPLKLIVGQRVVTILSVYSPQCCLSDADKGLFYNQLRVVTAKIPASEFLVPCGDWKSHVGSNGSGFREVHLSFWLGNLVCRRPCHHCRLHGRMCQKAAYLEGGYGEEGAESDHREDQCQNLWYRTRPIVELMRVPLCHLPHWSRQQLH